MFLFALQIFKSKMLSHGKKKKSVCLTLHVGLFPYVVGDFFIVNDFYLIGKQRDRESALSHPLVHSLNPYKSQGLASQSQELGTQSGTLL